MLRAIGAAAAGLVAWGVFASILDFILRRAWPAYAAVEKAMTFDLAMMLARLAESTLALVLAAVLVGRLAPASRAAPWAMGVVLLVFFIPVHYGLWPKFPIWYHLYFLSSLLLISGLVGSAARQR